jgi:hypothetical protein
MFKFKKYCKSIVALLLFYQYGVYAQSKRLYILLCGNLSVVVVIRYLCTLLDTVNVDIDS